MSKIGLINGELIGVANAIGHNASLMYISTPGTIAITTGGTFEKLLGGAIAYTGTHLEGFSHATGRLTRIGETKDFLISGAFTIESGENTQNVCLRIAKNGTTIEPTDMQADFSVQNSHRNAPLVWIVELAENDYIEIYVTSDTNGDDVIFHSGVIALTQYS